MPSQEDYLDRLLKEFSNKELVSQEPVDQESADQRFTDQESIDQKFIDQEPTDQEPDIPDHITEEDVERILQENQAVSKPDPAIEEKPGQENIDDLMNLLMESDNQGLTDIHDLLQKSDEHAIIEGNIEDSMEDNMKNDIEDVAENSAIDGGKSVTEEGSTAEENPEEVPAKSRKEAKAEKAALKKQQREEKKAAKQAARQAKLEKKAKEKNSKVNNKEKNAELGKNVELPEELAGGLADGLPEDPQAMDMSAMDELLYSGQGDAETYQSAEPAALDSTQTKKSLWSRILDFLTEEDLDDEEAGGLTGTEDVPMSDENRNILAEMDQEEKKEKKKSKKNKKGKEKNSKRSDGQSGEETEDSEDGDDTKKGKKPKKKEKPKKEKQPREKAAPGDQIPLKKILPVVAMGVSVLLVIILFSSLGGDYVVKRQARQAYYEEDYETCYQQLYGKKLSESEQVMYSKSESILRVRLWVREYEIYAGEGDRVRALDVLIQAVDKYPALYEYATGWNADKEVSEGYQKIVALLDSEFHLTEEQAGELAAIPDDVEYTKAVTAAAAGEGFTPQEGGAAVLPDMLPEEKNFPENNGGL